MPKGRLTIAGKKGSLTLLRFDSRSEEKVKTKRLSDPLKKIVEAARSKDVSRELTVEFDLASGLASNIRPAADEPPPPEEPKHKGRPGRTKGRPSGRSQQHHQHQQQRSAPVREFHNPYNFIPALPRETAQGTELGDRPPRGHQVYHSDCWSGTITVRLETVTPLLLPDAARATAEFLAGRQDPEKNHKTYPIRIGPDGSPYLSPTAIKGMLRSAYEAVTNSRMAIFSKAHEEPLDYSQYDPRRRRASRVDYERTPDELLDDLLKPAVSLNELSPADRVFGWVLQKGPKRSRKAAGPGAYRGQLRVSACQFIPNENGESPIETFGPEGLPLAILGEPKPQQFRFYLAGDSEGAPLPDGLAKRDGYLSNQSLRGRKAYPTHQRIDARYYRSHQDDRNHQNRSVLAWVKPQQAFQFELSVVNLTSIELGALLWLLSGEVPHHRLGGAKPLGLGTVRLSIESLELRDGAAIRFDITSLYTDSQGGRRITDAESASAAELCKEYQEAVARIYGSGEPFHKMRFIEAFLVAAKGFDSLPVCYPRMSADDAGGEHFKWFVANEKGPRLALQALWQPDPGLPYGRNLRRR